MNKVLTISTPGRICLFGEHQDYLGLPVIAAAISRRIYISGKNRADNKIIIHMPDISQTEEFELNGELIYHKERDYFKSVLNLLKRKLNVNFDKGFEVTVTGNIPINSGTSSSSALVVSWTKFLLETIGLQHEDINKYVGELAYLAEVEEFGEPGGRMDQYATAIGNIMYLETSPEIRTEKYSPKLGTFVLGDSLEAKDTLGILKHVKYGMLEIIRRIKAFDPDFDLHTFPYEEGNKYKSLLTQDEFTLFKSNLSDRDILKEAKYMFENDLINDSRLGMLLNLHQDNLRDAKRISTKKIDRMINAAIDAGALGAKINGSGGGGCMFAYAPGNPEAVVDAIEREGGKAYIVVVDEGTRVLS
ncbi:galactokinase [Pseudarcicella hirudinis]|uniref:Galactokinase n=1 Tax=Pseudarcicella hirudinis TaxID=1079859 RepID=A0A1I5VJ57_9BACT|nr:galactokinase family protein [Pseudarcicella hirudinis]SFQ07499.1 galactokinase [Pseudarcicella hirudinis]